MNQASRAYLLIKYWNYKDFQTRVHVVDLDTKTDEVGRSSMTFLYCPARIVDPNFILIFISVRPNSVFNQRHTELMLYNYVKLFS